MASQCPQALVRLARLEEALGGLFTLITLATDKPQPFQDVARDGHLLYVFLDHKAKSTWAQESQWPLLMEQVSAQGTLLGYAEGDVLCKA